MGLTSVYMPHQGLDLKELLDPDKNILLSNWYANIPQKACPSGSKQTISAKSVKALFPVKESWTPPKSTTTTNFIENLKYK